MNPPFTCWSPIVASSALLREHGVRPNTHVTGNPNSPVTVIEFGDFQCPVCRNYSETIEHQIIDNYVANGKIRYTFRQFPFSASFISTRSLSLSLPAGVYVFHQNDFVYVPDFGEPDGSLIEVAEKHILWLKINVKGKQTHASTPEKGINATRIGMCGEAGIDSSSGLAAIAAMAAAPHSELPTGTLISRRPWGNTASIEVKNSTGYQGQTTGAGRVG